LKKIRKKKKIRIDSGCLRVARGERCKRVERE